MAFVLGLLSLTMFSPAPEVVPPPEPRDSVVSTERRTFQLKEHDGWVSTSESQTVTTVYENQKE